MPHSQWRVRGRKKARPNPLNSHLGELCTPLGASKDISLPSETYYHPALPRCREQTLKMGEPRAMGERRVGGGDWGVG